MASAKDPSISSLCLPGPEEWELWAPPREGEGPLEKFASSPPVADGGAADAFKAAEIYGVPIAGAFCLPVWTASDDPEVLDGVIEMQLEGLGLKPANALGEHLDRKIVGREGPRALIRLTVLPDDFDEALPKIHPKSYFVTPDLYLLAENGVTVWRESGKLVFAVTRLDQAVYFQALTSSTFDGAAAHEIGCTVMTLQSQGVLERIERASIWLEQDRIAAGAPEAFGTSLGNVPVQVSPRPAPVRPLAGVQSEWLPAPVEVARLSAARKARAKKMVLGIAALYTFIAILAAGWIFYKKNEVAELDSQVAQLEPRAGWIPGMKTRWMDYQQTIDPNTYPIETFLRIYKLLPPKGVRLTTYEDSIESVTIVGEAQDQSVAIRFRNAIAREPSLERYVWVGSNPTVRRDRIAVFTITGKLKEEESPTVAAAAP